MTGRRGVRGAIALATALACLAAAPLASAMTAQQAFEDGNRLYRDDLYWAALLRYRQAGEGGMDTPLLHFNTGVAHYQAQQHIRARQSLLKAAQSPSLRVISHYNLGLNAYAAGDMDDALDWFRQARDQEKNEKIHKLAIIAISRIKSAQKEADPVLIRAEQRRKKKPLANFDLQAHVGFGTDNNVFRAPSQPYIDFADPAFPLVTPEAQSGAFVPVDFLAKYNVNSLKWESFFGQYRLSGRYYQDKEISDANEFSHELRFGSEFDRRSETRISRIYSAFAISQHDETYVDPDDGTPRAINGELIDDRMNYVRYGPEIFLRQGWKRISFGFKLKGQLWDYQETGTVPSYDHEYFVFGGNLQYKFAKTSLVRFSAEKYSRRYSERPSFDLNGDQLITNDSLRYDYLAFGLEARQRITEAMWFGFRYEITDREDRLQGYNDYTRDEYSFQYHWSPGQRFDLDIEAMYRNYDYPNAFAFHNPIAGPKTLETLDGEIAVRWRMTNSLSLNLEARYRDLASTDTRIAYDRMWYSLGVVWQQ